MIDEPRSWDSSDRGAVVAEIARLLRERFSQNEREALVRELGANPEDVKLKPETRDDFTWAMIDYFERRGRLTELCAAVERAVKSRGLSSAPGDVIKRVEAERKPAALFEVATRIGRRRMVLPYVCVLLALCTPFVVAVQTSATVRVPAKIPDALVWTFELSLDDIFPTRTSGTLVALMPRSSPEAAQAHQELCNKVKAVGGASARCIHLEDHGDDLLAKAKELGVSLAVAVDRDAAAHLVPLGRLAGDKLLEGGVRPIDVSRDGVADRLSRVLHQLSIIAASDFEMRDAVCISLPTDGIDPGAQSVLDEISLLAVYARQFVPWCIADKHECGLLDRVASCNPRVPETALSCELAMYLLVERCSSSPAADATLETLTGPDVTEAYRNVAMLKLARRYCSKGGSGKHRETASRMLFELARQSEPCVTATLSEVAACLMLTPAGGELEVSQNDELRRLAELSLESFDACGDTPVAARALAGRAYQRAIAGKWATAAADYDAAYQRHHLDDYLLGLAESLLHVGSTDAVKQASELLRYGEARPRSSAAPVESRLYLARIAIRRAVLSWIAANKRRLPKQELDALWEQVVHEYAATHDGDVAVSAHDGLKELLDKIQGGSCVFKRLSRRYTGSRDNHEDAMRRCMSE